MVSVLCQAVMWCDKIGGKLDSKQVNNVFRIGLAFLLVNPVHKQDGLRQVQWEGAMCTKRRTCHAAFSVKDFMVQILTIPRSRNCVSCHDNGRTRRSTVFDKKVEDRATTISMSRASVPLSRNRQFSFFTVFDMEISAKD